MTSAISRTPPTKCYASDSKELKGTPALPRLTGKSVMLYRLIFS